MSEQKQQQPQEQSQEQQQPQEQQQQQKKKGKGGLLVAIVIIALIGVIAYPLLSRKPEPEPEKERRGVLVTPENVESVLEEAEAGVPSGYYTVTMNPTWHFANGESSDAVVVNVEENTNDVYFDVVLVDDEEKVIYSSPIIPRGGRLEAIELDETLDAGTYDCIVIYHLVDEEQNTLSTLRVSLQIIIEG